MAQQQAAEHITSLDSRNIHNAAVVVMQPNTGQILAMVGSVDYNAIEETRTPGQEGNVLDGQVNVAIRERQPGSALKPFTYLAAMEQGMTPASVLWDVPTEFPTGSGEWYAPENYNGRWNGPVRMRAALANSLNMPAVKALKVAGIGNTLDLLDRVGIREGLERGEGYYGLSLTLGGGEVTLLELTTAYNTLASGGRYYPPAPILSITDSDGNMIESYQQTPGEQVVDPALVAIITDMMSDDRARQPIWGLNSALNLSQPAAVKTGTSNDWRDAWTAGFTPYVTVGVWSGNNNNEPTERVESLQGGGIIWGNVMEELFTWIDTQPSYNELFSAPFPDSTLQRAFTLPPGDAVVRNPVCSIPGAFGGDDEELFTQAMLQNAEASSSGRLGCDMYVRIPVVRTPSGSYCRPLRGENYPSSWMETVTVWDIPESDGSERVQYRWSGGSAGRSAGAYPVCTPAMLVPPTPVPTPTPDRPAPPVAGAVQMPSLIGYGENQAKSILAGLGVTSVVVDYQTRDRVPQLFDSYGPYVVLSTSPTAGNWIMPGTTVVLGIRSPDESAPADAGSNGRGTRNQAPQPTNPPASRDSSSGLWPPLATPTSVGLPPPAGTSQAIPGARP
jgi:peptidoglycan glycosyltransferase